MSIKVEFSEKELDNLIKVTRAYWVELDNKLKKAPAFNKPVIELQKKQAWRAYNSIKDLMD